MKRFGFTNDKELLAVFSEKKDGDINIEGIDPQKAKKNRQKLFNRMKIKTENIYEAGQIHGANIVIITKINKNQHFWENTDGLITNLNNTFLMLKVADCLPVLFYDYCNKVVAAAHCGWRGAIEKIFLEILFKLTQRFNCNLKNIKVLIGPGVRDCCFIHDHLVQEKLPEWKKYFRKTKYGAAIDIPGFIKDKLISYGIKKVNLFDCGICTVCQKNLFSHYRSLRFKEEEGRLAVIIGMKNN